MALVQEQHSKRAAEFLVLDQAVAPPDLNGPPIVLSMFLTLAAMLVFMGLSALNKMIFGG